MITVWGSQIAYGAHALDTLNKRKNFIKSQKDHFEKGQFDKYFGKRAYVNALGSVDESGHLKFLAREQGILDVLAFSKLCDFSMAKQTLANVNEMILGVNEKKSASLAKEYYELRMKLYPKAAERAQKETKKLKIHWKVPKSYLAKVKNLDLLRVKVEGKCE